MNLELFNYSSTEVRTILDEKGDPWFVAKDICDILGHTNSRKALLGLDDDEKGVTYGYTLGGEQLMATVNESGLYHLIFLSRLSNAKAFRKWVTAELLPTLRKTGTYDLKHTDPLSFTSDIKYNSSHIAKLLGVSPVRLYKALRSEGYVYQDGSKWNIATIESLEGGLMVLDKTFISDKKTGEAKIKYVSRYTPKFIDEVLPKLAPMFSKY